MTTAGRIAIGMSAGLAVGILGSYLMVKRANLPPVPAQQPCKISETDIEVPDPDHPGKCWATDKTGCTAAVPCPKPTLPPAPKWTGEKVRTP